MLCFSCFTTSKIPCSLNRYVVVLVYTSYCWFGFGFDMHTPDESVLVCAGDTLWILCVAWGSAIGCLGNQFMGKSLMGSLIG